MLRSPLRSPLQSAIRSAFDVPQQESAPPPPPDGSALLLGDGTSYLILADGGKILLGSA